MALIKLLTINRVQHYNEDIAILYQPCLDFVLGVSTAAGVALAALMRNAALLSRFALLDAKVVFEKIFEVIQAKIVNGKIESKLADLAAL